MIGLLSFVQSTKGTRRGNDLAEREERLIDVDHEYLYTFKVQSNDYFSAPPGCVMTSSPQLLWWSDADVHKMERLDHSCLNQRGK